MILGTEKLGRNETCHCGSGKKYKNCCLEVDERKKNPRRMTSLGFQRCFLKAIKDMGGELEIVCKEVDLLPKDEGLAMIYNARNDSFIFKVIKVKMQKIITPNKRIIA